MFLGEVPEIWPTFVASLAWHLGGQRNSCVRVFFLFICFYLLDFFWAWEMGERMEPDEILSNGHQP